MTRTHIAIIAGVFFMVACDKAPTQPSAAATPRFAAGSTTQQVNVPLAGTITNPCTGEAVAYAGNAHEVVTSWSSGGVNYLKAHINLQDFHGTTPAGVNYVIQEIAKEQQDFTPTPPYPSSTTQHAKLKLTSQGSGDNYTFLVDETFTYDGSTYTYTITSSNTCTG